MGVMICLRFCFVLDSSLAVRPGSTPADVKLGSTALQCRRGRVEEAAVFASLCVDVRLSKHTLLPKWSDGFTVGTMGGSRMYKRKLFSMFGALGVGRSSRRPASGWQVRNRCGNHHYTVVEWPSSLQRLNLTRISASIRARLLWGQEERLSAPSVRVPSRIWPARWRQFGNNCPS